MSFTLLASVAVLAYVATGLIYARSKGWKIRFDGILAIVLVLSSLGVALGDWRKIVAQPDPRLSHLVMGAVIGITWALVSFGSMTRGKEEGSE